MCVIMSWNSHLCTAPINPHLRPNIFSLAVEKIFVKLSEVDVAVTPKEFRSSVGQVV